MKQRICIFTFNNGTNIRVAVMDHDREGNQYSYDQIFAWAKERSWMGDEERGRGRLRSFEIGDWITMSSAEEEALAVTAMAVNKKNQ
jgi:hypothetical protein